ncbi:MAG: PepSY-associated TM helix domain-containing protein [Candidatus Entotheonellia bacterium]
MTHSPLAKAILSSMFVHLTVLLSLSSFWGSLRLASLPADLIPAELVTVAPPPPVPEPITTPEVTPLTPPEILTKTDVMLAKPPPPPPPEPRVPSKMEPLTRPKAVEKPLPKRSDIRSKPLPTAKRIPPKAQKLQPGPPPGPDTTTFAKPKPGPPIPIPDEGPAPAGSNALGPASAANPAGQPAKSIEGGEAGAGELSERGDLPVVPGTGVAGGSGSPGREGLGWGAEGSGVRSGGLRPGAGGEGPEGHTHTIQPPVSSAPRLSPDALVIRAREAVSAGTPTSVTLRAHPTTAALISFGREQTVFVDPYTGAVLGEGATALRGFFHIMTDWHRWLGTHGASREIGRAVTGACNAACVVLVITGFYLWWPRHWTRIALKIATVPSLKLRGKPRDWNGHNTVGFWSAPALFFITVTGVVMSYQWANSLIYTLTGSDPPPMPQRPLASPAREASAGRGGSMPAMPGSTPDGRGERQALPEGGVTGE